MDPVSHLMLGGAMAAAMPREIRPRGTAAALVVGAIFPDADIILVPRWFDLYFLYVHPALTHALTWSFPEALVFAALLRPFVRGARFWVLALGGWLGIVGHIFSDFADGSDIVLFSPLSPAQYGWHLFGMGEPFVLILLGSACLAAWRWPRRAPVVAFCAFGSLAAILSAKAIAGQQALSRYLTTVPQAQARVEIVPVRNGLFEWEIYDQVGADVRVWRVNARSGRCELVLEHHNATGALVAASRELPLVRDLLTLTKIWIVRSEHRGDDTVVLWSDARMCDGRGCDVSFGGMFTPSGVPRSQVIRLGEFQQERRVP